ncbi:MAG: hypothetical protein PHV43_02705 [Candidatus Colwellbacteria bacterium]|nr:hypothetical protein [Candidatus Colwellbacteria bacterium]
MNKKLILIGTVVFILAVVLFVIFLAGGRSGRDEATEGISTSDKPFAVAIDGTWNEITFPADGVSVRVPQRWDTYVYDVLRSGVASRYSTSWATAELYLYYDERPYAENVEKYKNNPEYSLIYEGEDDKQVAKYIGQIPIGALLQLGDGELTAKGLAAAQGSQKNSYVRGQVASLQNGSLIIHCQTSGPDYASFISDCNEVVESLSIE